jgi:hypothetical protein
MVRWLTLGVRAPRAGAPRVEGRRFVRDMQLRVILATVPLVALAVAEGLPSWFLAGVGLSLVLLVATAVVLTASVRREERRPPDA